MPKHVFENSRPCFSIFRYKITLKSRNSNEQDTNSFSEVRTQFNWIKAPLGVLVKDIKQLSGLGVNTSS